MSWLDWVTPPPSRTCLPWIRQRMRIHADTCQSNFFFGVFNLRDVSWTDAQTLQAGQPSKSPFTEEETARLSEFLSREKDSPSTSAASAQSVPSATLSGERF